MPHYVRHITEHQRELWLVEGGRATRVGVTNPPVHEAENGRIWERIDQVFGDGAHRSFVQLNLEPGYYHRRMSRTKSEISTMGWTLSPEIPQEDRDYAAMARSQLETLVSQLLAICRTIHPTPANFSSYGHDTRNLLILACTEVETHLKGILTVNGVKRRTMNIRDYAYVSEPLNLPSYELSFPAFPWLDPVRPFRNFGTGLGLNSTLAWYSAYNAVKHDREREFEKATLGSIFDAVAACAILIVAQFGWSQGLKKGSELSKQFHFISQPTFHPEDWYYGPLSAEIEPRSQSKNFDFKLPSKQS